MKTTGKVLIAAGAVSAVLIVAGVATAGPGGWGPGWMHGGGNWQGGPAMMQQGNGYSQAMMQGGGYGRGIMQGGGAQSMMGWMFGDTAKMLEDAKAKLAIRAEQEEAWKGYTETFSAVVDGHKAWRESMASQNTAQMTAQERTEFMKSARETRTQEFQDIAKAQETLFAALDAPQKQVATSLLMGSATQTSQYGPGMRGGRSRMGGGWGGGCGRW